MSKQAHPRDLAETEAMSYVKALRVSPRKLNLIAGLIGTMTDDAAVAPELRRLRWLFLGWKPDFVRAHEVVTESLDARAPQGDAVIRCVESFYAALNADVAADFLNGVRRTTDAVETTLKNPETRLVELQAVVNALIAQGAL
jgi:hypothetical protein